MNRRWFLKKLGIGAAVLPITPVIAESVVHFPNNQYLDGAPDQRIINLLDAKLRDFNKFSENVMTDALYGDDSPYIWKQ